MLFNSLDFIFLFLPISIFVYFICAKIANDGIAKSFLVVASFYFYSYWNLPYVALLFASISINYLLSILILKLGNQGKKKRVLILAIGLNLCLIGYYKYCDFFIYNINSISGTSIIFQNILLPLGISFFTFQQIAYQVDIFKGKTAETCLLNYILFVSFFPQLIAGPIVHHKEMMPQFKKPIDWNPQRLFQGLTFFILGLFKKVIIADNIAIYANIVFDGYSTDISFSIVETWVGIFAYCFQIYFDFSGYTDMAIGLALIFGIYLPLNFNSPYKALSIIDFWRRWHMTLSRFLRNYLYIPIGGNKGGEWMRLRNLLITMLIGGLWHGAYWNYIIWGGVHGLAISINHTFRKFNRFPENFFFRNLSYGLTFLTVSYAWVFFRASNMDVAFNMTKACFGLNGIDLPRFFSFIISPEILFDFIRLNGAFTSPDLNFHSIFYLFVLYLIVKFLPTSSQLMKWSKECLLRQSSLREIGIIWAYCMGLLFFISIKPLFDNGGSDFLYFNF
jgi:D-alanyl-lipoteichoic acid acyltransferase DltB (MBOAT superfamily)